MKPGAKIGWFTLCVSIIVTRTTAEKILLLPILFGSHVMENLHLGETLISKGHDIRMVLPVSTRYNAKLKTSRVQALNFNVPDDARRTSRACRRTCACATGAGTGTGIPVSSRWV